MKIKYRYNIIGLLMVVSQLLLTGFTIYWLSGQFREEKERLVRELSLTYRDAMNQALDSLLIEHYIDPLMGDPAFAFRGPKIIRGIHAGSDTTFAVAPGGAIYATDSGAARSATAMVTINLQERDSAMPASEARLDEFRREMALRSVRLIIRNSDSTGVHNGMLHGQFFGLDTALFTESFETMARVTGPGLKPVWIDSAGPGLHGDRREIIIGGWEDTLPLASFPGYRGLVFKRITPQLLFTLVLLILTGSAFLLASNSLRKEVRLNVLRSNFISNISHELKTPVSTLLIALGTIRTGLKGGSRETKEYVDIASGEVKRLEKLITRVLDNSVMEEGGPMLRREEVGLRLLIAGLIEAAGPAASKAGASIQLEEGEEVYATVDRCYIESVIGNLLDNSLKYAGPSPEILVSVLRSGEFARISVADNGPGIPEQYRSKVFDKFFRVPEKDTHNVKGYGLGLSFVKSVVVAHGGSVEVKNMEKGCIFTIKLPVG